MVYVGFVWPYMLHKFDNPTLFTLGTSLLYRSLIVSDVKPDSLASTPPLITRASDVVTIRIIPLKTAADWQVVEEYRDRYVFKRVFHRRRFVDILFSDWIVAFNGCFLVR